MQVFNEPELGLVRRDSEDFLPVRFSNANIISAQF